MRRRWFNLESRWWRAWMVLFPLLFAYGVGQARGSALGIVCAVLMVPPFWWMAVAPTAQQRFARDHRVAEAASAAPTIGFFAIAALFPGLALTTVGLLAAAYALLVVGISAFRGRQPQPR